MRSLSFSSVSSAGEQMGVEEEPCSSGGPTGRDPSAQGNALGRVGGTASGRARGRSHEPSPMGWAEGTQAVGPEQHALFLRRRGAGGEVAGEQKGPKAKMCGMAWHSCPGGALEHSGPYFAFLLI